MIDYDQILIEPVLSEKANMLRETGSYVFRVNMKSNKLQIKEAIRRLYNVHPVSCNVVVVGGKPKRQRNRAGTTSTWKKATVRLAKDEKISVFEGV
jgi:large subunit ribosomal protein L23